MGNHLVIEDAAQILSLYAAKTIRLKHLNSAWTSLESFLIADIFGSVESIYRETIPANLQGQIDNVLSLMSNDIPLMLAPIRDTILSQLCQQHTKATESLKLWLSFIYTDDDRQLSDVAHFDLLPSELSVCHALDFYNTMEKFESGKDKL